MSSFDWGCKCCIGSHVCAGTQNRTRFTGDAFAGGANGTPRARARDRLRPAAPAGEWLALVRYWFWLFFDLHLHLHLHMFLYKLFACVFGAVASRHTVNCASPRLVQCTKRDPNLVYQLRCACAEILAAGIPCILLLSVGLRPALHSAAPIPTGTLSLTAAGSGLACLVSFANLKGISLPRTGVVTNHGLLNNRPTSPTIWFRCRVAIGL